MRDDAVSDGAVSIRRDPESKGGGRRRVGPVEVTLAASFNLSLMKLMKVDCAMRFAGLSAKIGDSDVGLSLYNDGERVRCHEILAPF